MKYFLFDLDGTVLHSNEALIRLYKDCFAHFGLPEPAGEDVLRYNGNTAEDWVPLLEPSVRREKIPEIVAWLRNAYANEYMPKYGKAEPGAVEMLEELRGRGAKLCVVTNQMRTEATSSLRVMGFKFDEEVCMKEGLTPKPAPDLVFEGMKRLDAKKEETLFVGDSFADAGAGKAAGVRTVLVRRFWNADIDAEKIDSLKEVLKFL
ncbi:Glyceraldehyde 3-phosphate phosphatase [Candidatus Norongarragalina meridionalis]|nr:Glyceraldehyde 3-phosphate phosphatase [Candidatus Norongarragalina meridionalis]